MNTLWKIFLQWTNLMVNGSFSSNGLVLALLFGVFFLLFADVVPRIWNGTNDVGAQTEFGGPM